jgi:site-specific recombinase XerD
VQADVEAQAGLSALGKRVTPKAGGLSGKVTTLLRQFDSRANVAAVLTLPRHLMARANTGKLGNIAAARNVQTALAIELLTVAPIRIGELCSLELGRNVFLPASGSASIEFVRNGHRSEDIIRIRLPYRTRRLLARYLREHRPLLCGPGCMALFPGKRGGTKTDQAVAHQIRSAVMEITGLVVTPGLFRHFAAKHYLERHPGGFGVVRFALGHKSLQTTVDKYAELDGAAAFRIADRYLLAPARPAKRQSPALKAPRVAQRKSASLRGRRSP